MRLKHKEQNPQLRQLATEHWAEVLAASWHAPPPQGQSPPAAGAGPGSPQVAVQAHGSRSHQGHLCGLPAPRLGPA